MFWSGDYSAEEDRHVPKAVIPKGLSVQVLICESTYGLKLHEPRLAREARFILSIEEIVLGRKGKCLLPIFALGRVQELLLILNQHWSTKPETLGNKVPIIYLSALSDKGMEIMTEYAAAYAGTEVKHKAMKGQNAFKFNHVRSGKNLDEIRYLVTRNEPCVVLAAPGMMQSGASREIFELWAPDE